ncbi:hypothetical protein [Kaistella palustris]|uniref:hypothetical protein n=1 Tax=Kaistella palustris TaxID=493376 RepID=UPI0004266DC9|nr:hypothetical protein [Kaistella palustris]
MRNVLFAGALLFTFCSCEKKITETPSAERADSVVVVPETNEPIESSTVQSCYAGNTGKDSVFISLEDNLGTLTGKMRYKNFEKDSSSGDIIGTKNGDTLKLTYNFTAEGTKSEREIYFLLKDGKITEGIGDHKTEGMQDFYANPSQLKYEGNSLSPVDCTDFTRNFSSK